MKIAIVTGAGSGIGKTVALALLKDGFAVVLAGRRQEALEMTATESGEAISRALVVPTDICQPESVEALFSQTKEKFGRLDLLFNNAGMATSAMPLEDVPFEVWKKVVDTNLTGAFLCTQQAFKMMKNQDPTGGRIINNGSISAHVPRPYAIAYNATKHAITGLTKSTSLEGRDFDISCGQIDIGNAGTDMTKAMTRGVLQANGKIAVEPTMDAKHVAEAVLYMAHLPLNVNVPFMTVMANQMPFIGRG